MFRLPIDLKKAALAGLLFGAALDFLMFVARNADPNFPDSTPDTGSWLIGAPICFTFLAMIANYFGKR